ncbi:DsrE family protein [Algoriphagus sediminis]|uniref:DsrE family protein n=1 Tax=Algoriphagus sediminis TaxID=3057113 RepID=A0ABT7Y9J0_9BACT|nr:DsrE family protein [Algoriphagus sediminis]MDN3203183.1 DsrE family protein [Algoriphagus sediminis]
MKKLLILPIFLCLIALQAYSQSAQYPIVKGHGGIYEIENATERPDPNREYKIIVDLTSAANSPAQVNRWVDNIARMMNLHGLAGVPKENLHVKVVVHGGAAFSLLNDENYQERYQTDNPNLEVYDALKAAGAEIYVCGQSLIARNLDSEDLWPDVQVALSALTTITTYVPEGYTYLKF